MSLVSSKSKENINTFGNIILEIIVLKQILNLEFKFWLCRNWRQHFGQQESSMFKIEFIFFSIESVDIKST